MLAAQDFASTPFRSKILRRFVAELFCFQYLQGEGYRWVNAEVTSFEDNKMERKRPAVCRPFVSKTQPYFLGAMASLVALATRNFTTVLAGILIGSPVCGFLPIRALRFDFTRRPSPGITNMPLFLVSLIAVSVSVCRNVAAVLLLVSSFSARWRTSCVLVMPAAMNPPYW